MLMALRLLWLLLLGHLHLFLMQQLHRLRHLVIGKPWRLRRRILCLGFWLRRVLGLKVSVRPQNPIHQISWSVARQVGVTTCRNSTGAPWTSASDFFGLLHWLEGLGVTQWYIDDAMMGKGAHCRKGSALLSSPLRSGGNEQATVFTPVTTSEPHLASGIPEGFPLGGEISVTSWNTHKESIVFLELFSGDEWDVFALLRDVHFGEDILRQGLFDSSSEVRQSPIRIKEVDA